MNPNVEMEVFAGMAKDHWQQIMKEITTESQLERMRVDEARKKLSNAPIPRMRFKLSYAIAVVLLLAMLVVQIVAAAANASGGGGVHLVR